MRWPRPSGFTIAGTLLEVAAGGPALARVLDHYALRGYGEQCPNDEHRDQYPDNIGSTTHAKFPQELLTP